jgi:hypothetical protein
MEVKAGSTIRRIEDGELFKVRHVVKRYEKDTGKIPAGSIVVRIETEGLHQLRFAPGTYKVLCDNCIYMRSIGLPDHTVEVFMESLHECDDLGSVLAEWIKERIPEDHEFPTVWTMRKYIRKEHIRYHREKGTSCGLYEALEKKLGAEKLLELTA